VPDDKLYVRSLGAVEVFSFDSTTGAMRRDAAGRIPIASAGTYCGVDQLALNRAGTRSTIRGNAVNVYDTSSGALLGSITDPGDTKPPALCTTPSVCSNSARSKARKPATTWNLIDGDGCDSNCTVGLRQRIVTAGESCDDGNLNNADCCSNSCTPAADATPCNDLLFCNGPDSCLSGACTVHSGDPCSGGPECNNTCTEATDSCAASNGTPCTDEGNVCTDDVCDGLGMCGHVNNFFVPCDDGMFCNGADACFGGSCSFHNGDPCAFFECNTTCDDIGTECDPSLAAACSDDGTVCTDDECDGAGGCTHPPVSSGLPCPDDGNECTGDQCDGLGACGHPPLSNSTSCTDDGNECTSDKCNGAGACGHPALMNGTGCNDDNACTQTDQCQSGACVGTAPVQCTAGLCTVAGICDPSTGDCVNCPAGYAPGGGGCQKTYTIDLAHLDNLDNFCDGTGDHRYDCDRPHGFHRPHRRWRWGSTTSTSSSTKVSSAPPSTTR
jgi:hypothetical protein